MKTHGEEAVTCGRGVVYPRVSGGKHLSLIFKCDLLFLGPTEHTRKWHVKMSCDKSFLSWGYLVVKVCFNSIWVIVAIQAARLDTVESKSSPWEENDVQAGLGLLLPGASVFSNLSDLLFYQWSLEIELMLTPKQDSKFVMSEMHTCTFTVEWDGRGDK